MKLCPYCICSCSTAEKCIEYNCHCCAEYHKKEIDK